jgi:RNA polymerase sigma factor (sigma-70 family)
MGHAASVRWMTAEEERRISAEIEQRRPRLRNFIRGRVPDVADAEDILQDVLFELVESYRAPRPVEQVGAWLFRVARNRITDFFRKKKPEALTDAIDLADDEGLAIEELLPSSPSSGTDPEAAYARSVLLDELDAALAELPAAQRDTFIATEIEGRSFKDLAAETGESVNTLLSRKRYAVLHLRGRLRDIYEEIVEGE